MLKYNIVNEKKREFQHFVRIYVTKDKRWKKLDIKSDIDKIDSWDINNKEERDSIQAVRKIMAYWPGKNPKDLLDKKSKYEFVIYTINQILTSTNIHSTPRLSLGSLLSDKNKSDIIKDLL
jgi:hypothetical protein